MKNKKFILDATCGCRYMWFNKNHPNTIYIDKRIREKGHNKRRKNEEVQPDIQMDNRKMDFKDKSFKLVVFDPPHLFLGKNSILAKTYGRLDKETWKQDIKKAFNECWRVLEDYGVLIFKWNSYDVKKSEVLKVINKEPLFGHITNMSNNTHWFTFMKIPEEEEDGKRR